MEAFVLDNGESGEKGGVFLDIGEREKMSVSLTTGRESEWCTTAVLPQ